MWQNIRRSQPEIDYCDANDDGGAVHRCLHAIMHLIEDHAAEAGIPVRFAASKLAEGDSLILDSLHLDQNEKEMLEHIIVQMENERGLDRAAAIAHMRFDFIQKICDETVIKPKESKEHLRSVAIDKILTGKYTAIPCFIGIMGLVFFLTFGVIGAFLSDLLDLGITSLGNLVDGLMTSWNVNQALHSLVIDGIFNGVGSVLSFLPIIVTLVFLPVTSGRQWLYGAGCLCHGQAARKIVCQDEALFLCSSDSDAPFPALWQAELFLPRETAK